MGGGEPPIQPTISTLTVLLANHKSIRMSDECTRKLLL